MKLFVGANLPPPSPIGSISFFSEDFPKLTDVSVPGKYGGTDGSDGQGNENENNKGSSKGNPGKGSGFNLTAVEIPGFVLR